MAELKPLSLACSICGKPVVKDRKLMLEYVRKGRAYCSVQCSGVYHRAVSSKTASATNKKYAAQRMQNKNPMCNPESVQKMRDTKQSNGTLNIAPKVRGGNGKTSVTQLALSNAIGWPMEHVVPVGMGRGNGYPTCYKIDIADPASMIAIEVDGSSHNSHAARERDARKDAFLKSQGWHVLRFSNRQVTEDLQGCVDSILAVYIGMGS